MDILLLGPPGAGKGTQGALLAKALELPKFATGDLLRDAVKHGTPLGLKARAVMEAGHLVSDEIILGVIREELAKPAAANGVIFDGVVRTIPQARGRGRRCSRDRGRKIDHVLFFDVPMPELLQRLTARRARGGARRRRSHRGRHAPRGVSQQTAPVIDWYETHGGVTRIDAVGTVDEVARASAAGPGADVITIKSAREIDTMARAGRIVYETLALMRSIVAPGTQHRGSRSRGGEVHPVASGCHAVVQGAVRLPEDAVHVDRRGDRARHSVHRSACCARARSCRWMSASASTDCTPIRRPRFRSVPSRPTCSGCST